jgi:hypothetical protein
MVSKLDAIYVIGFIEKGAINIGEIKWFGDKNNGRMFVNAQKGVHETCIQQIFINESLVVVSVNINQRNFYKYFWGICLKVSESFLKYL